MRLAGPLRIVVFVLALGLLWILASLMSAQGGLFNRMRQLLSGPQELPTTETQPRRYKCGLPMPCPDKHFAFRIVSGAANVIGPKFCLEDRVFMSSVKNNVGRGLNIALVNGVTGELIDTKFFDMWAGDTGITDLLKFLRPIYEGTLVFVASYDDPATKMNEEAKKIFSELGSKAIHMLGFRDSWVFVGAKGIDNKSPFEQHVKNDKNTNKYEGWPEAVEMEGCIPHKQMASQELWNWARRQVLPSRRAGLGRQGPDCPSSSLRGAGLQVTDPESRMIPAASPMKSTRTHQDLHRELRLAHRKGLASKTELQKVLEQREQRRVQGEPPGSSPLQQEFIKRQQKKEEMLRLQMASQAEVEGAPEFVRVKERLRRAPLSLEPETPDLTEPVSPGRLEPVSPGRLELVSPGHLEPDSGYQHSAPA